MVEQDRSAFRPKSIRFTKDSALESFGYLSFGYNACLLALDELAQLFIPIEAEGHVGPRYSAGGRHRAYRLAR